MPKSRWLSQNRTVEIHTCQSAAAADDQNFTDVVKPDFEGKGGSALYEFSRPHTMIGTALGVTSISFLAIQGVALTPQAAQALAQALVAALLANISIVGLNQCFDVEIDKINKPYLPLASGEMSMNQGIFTVALTLALSVLICFIPFSRPLLATVVASHVLGFVYSTDLPLLRWKKYPILAAGCILCVRAVFVQLGFFLHMLQSYGIHHVAHLPRSLLFSMGFMLFYSIVIALFKDIPDHIGDAKAGVKTFTVRYGVSRVFWVSIVLLEVAYAAAVGFGLTSKFWWSKLIACAGHAGLGLLLWVQATRVNVNSKQAIVNFYMLIWKLFYAEYLLIPFLR